MLSHVSNAVVQGGVGYTIIPGHLEFEGDQVEVLFLSSLVLQDSLLVAILRLEVKYYIPEMS